MTTLYLVNLKAQAQQLPAILNDGDSVLLCGDAVLVWQQNWPQQVSVHLLAEDTIARNLQPAASIPTVDYAGFVELCSQSDKVTAW